MLRKESNGITWLEFELLREVPNLTCICTTRHGGFSTPPYDSLNLAYGVGDREEAVRENLRKVQQQFQIAALIYAEQVHGTKLIEVDGTSERLPLQCDGLLTQSTNLGLMIKTADCQAALFYDPIHHAAAVVHCGWRGSVQNMYAHTIETMRTTYGTHVEDLLVCISPSIGPEGAEFIDYKKELPEPFWKHQERPNHFDFWEISREQLLEAGIRPHHLEIARICTYSNTDDFFSYRRQSRTGRMAMLVTLR